MSRKAIIKRKLEPNSYSKETPRKISRVPIRRGPRQRLIKNNSKPTSFIKEPTINIPIVPIRNIRVITKPAPVQTYMKRSVTDTELFVAIQSSITNSTPLSYIRIGDGEVQLIKLLKHCGTEEIAIKNHALKHILLRYNERYTEDSQILNSWRKVIVTALKTSDYCGMFTPGEVTELMALGWLKDANKETTIRRYVSSKEMHNHYGIDTAKLKICSVMFNKGEQLGIIENFKQLVGDKRITIITNQTENLKKNHKFQINLGNQVDFITIKHEHGNPESKAFYQKDWVRSHFKDIKSHVVLFGMGGAAKELCNELKNDWGKCAIDMGSTLDAWAGIISRPSTANIWKHCLTVPVEGAPETDICYK